MTNFKISIVDKNSAGDVLRCPRCGQVLFVINSLEGNMKTTIQCRRCHNYIEVECNE